MGGERFDINTLAASIGLDPEMYRSLLVTLCTRSREDVRRLLHALEHDDRKQIRETAHSIKGAAAGLALIPLRDVAAEIETSAANAPPGTIEDAARSIEEEIVKIETAFTDASL